ncbi:hypothetical protein DPMN_130073, partial [Dreissena polymorpha]
MGSVRSGFTVPIPRDFLRSVWGVKCQQKHDKVITYLALVSGQGLREEKIEKTVSRDRNAIQKGTLGVSKAKIFFAMLIALMIAHLLSGSFPRSVDKQSTNFESTFKAVSKRAIHDLHKMAENAPDDCLLDLRFQEIIQSLLE